MENTIETAGTLFGAIIMLVLFSFLFSLPVMLLWNHVLMELIPGIREATWLQAWGLSVLCSFLFKSAQKS
jgi:hypothetical protein